MEVGLTSTIDVVSISSPKMPVYRPTEKMKKKVHNL